MSIETLVPIVFPVANTIRKNGYAVTSTPNLGGLSEVTNTTYEMGILRPKFVDTLSLIRKRVLGESPVESDYIGTLYIAEPSKWEDDEHFKKRFGDNFLDMGGWVMDVYGKENLMPLEMLATEISNGVKRNISVVLASENQRNGAVIDRKGKVRYYGGDD